MRLSGMVLRQKVKEGSWRDCSVVRGLAAFPQTLHKHGSSQLYVTPVLGDSMSSSCFHRPYVHVVHRYIHVGKTPIHIKVRQQQKTSN